eukprot:3489890-Pyramimonas_sp.AAC.1
MMVQRGWKRAEYLKSVERSLSAKWESIRQLPSSKAMDMASETLVTTLNECAQPFFSRGPFYAGDHKRH